MTSDICSAACKKCYKKNENIEFIIESMQSDKLKNQ
jgi:hypothetical protein